SGLLGLAVRGKFIDRKHPSVVAWLSVRPAPAATDAEIDLRTRKRQAEVELIELPGEREKGEGTRRDFVKHHVIGLLEELSLRFLRAIPQALAVRVASLARTGAPTEEIAKLISDTNSRELDEAKMRIVRNLRGPNDRSKEVRD